jgi:hypothetical protein
VRFERGSNLRGKVLVAQRSTAARFLQETLAADLRVGLGEVVTAHVPPEARPADAEQIRSDRESEPRVCDFAVPARVGGRIPSPR